MIGDSNRWLLVAGEKEQREKETRFPVKSSILNQSLTAFSGLGLSDDLIE
jgi:hypothetical protein